MNISRCFDGDTLREIQSLREEGIDPLISHYGEVDIAYPTNEKEYCGISGYSVL